MSRVTSQYYRQDHAATGGVSLVYHLPVFDTIIWLRVTAVYDTNISTSNRNPQPIRFAQSTIG